MSEELNVETTPAVVEVTPEPAPVVAEEPVVVSSPEPEPAPAPEMNRAIHGSKMEAVPAEEPKSKNEEPAQPVKKVAPVKRVVVLSSLKYEALARKSLSVAYVQERLVSLGFYDASSDKKGWFSAGTKKALAEYANTSVDKLNIQDADLITRLFDGTGIAVEK